jgi:predicted nucleic acid-binding protein
LLDTNVLLAATDQGRAEHASALDVFNEWPVAGTALYTTGQIIREYLSVSTRPSDLNGLGLAQADAVANVRQLRERLRFLAESDRVNEQLLDLLDQVECRGKQIHDANVVATMLVHGVDTVVTINTQDFARFSDHVAVVGVTHAR